MTTDSTHAQQLTHANRLHSEANATLKAYLLSNFRDQTTFNALVLRTERTSNTLREILKQAPTQAPTVVTFEGRVPMPRCSETGNYLSHCHCADCSEAVKGVVW